MGNKTNNTKYHFIPYKVYDLVTGNIIFKAVDLNSIAKFLEVNIYNLKKTINTRVYKHRYFVCSGSVEIPTISEEYKMKHLLNSIGMIGKDLYRPTLQDLEALYGLCRDYSISEDFFWNYINSKFRVLRFV